MSPEYVRDVHCMTELEVVLARQRTDPDTVTVVPVFYGISFQQCSDLEAVYCSQEWLGSEPKPGPVVLAGWAQTIRELLRSVAVREDQVRQNLLLTHLMGCSHTLYCVVLQSVSYVLL